MKRFLVVAILAGIIFADGAYADRGSDDFPLVLSCPDSVDFDAESGRNHTQTGLYSFSPATRSALRTLETLATEPYEVIWEEDFESGYGDWFPENGVWEIGVPTSGPAAVTYATGLTGTEMAATVLAGNYTYNTKSRLYNYSHKIILPEMQNKDDKLLLKLKHWYSYSNADHGQVQISVYEDYSWGDWINVGPQFKGTLGVYYPSVPILDIDITEYAGKTIRMAFYHYEVHGGDNEGGYSSAHQESSGWYIDRVQIVLQHQIPFFKHEETFEEGHGDWFTDHQGVWQIGKPSSGPGKAFEGNSVAATVLKGNYPYNRRSHFISAPFILSSTSSVDDSIVIRFWHWYSYKNADHGKVQIRTLNDSTWGDWHNVGPSFKGTSGVWIPVIPIDITSFAGNTVQIGFYHGEFHGGNSEGGYSSAHQESTGWYIDDLKIISTISGDPPTPIYTPTLSPLPTSTPTVTPTPTLTVTPTPTPSEVEVLDTPTPEPTPTEIESASGEGILRPGEMTYLVDYFPKDVNGENGIYLQSRDLSDNQYRELSYRSDYNFYTPEERAWGTPDIYPRKSDNPPTIQAHPAGKSGMGFDRDAIIQVRLNGNYEMVTVKGSVLNTSWGGVNFYIYKGENGYSDPIWKSSRSINNNETESFELTIPYQDGDELYFATNSEGSGFNDWARWVNVSFEVAEEISTITIPLDLPDGSTPLEMVYIPPGSFMMGTPEDDNTSKWYSYSTPQHLVTLTKGYYIGKYEMTQAQWTAVMGSNPSSYKEPNNPVNHVKWSDCQSFVQKLNQLNIVSGEFRLPTEAEWEYACRAGTTTRYYWGNDLNYEMIDQYAWHPGNSGNRPHEVGQLLPNNWGLYDMSGNILEWVNDFRGRYSSEPQIDPTGPATGDGHIDRGGAWRFYTKDLCRSDFRTDHSNSESYNNVGFRITLTLEELEIETPLPTYTPTYTPSPTSTQTITATATPTSPTFAPTPSMTPNPTPWGIHSNDPVYIYSMNEYTDSENNLLVMNPEGYDLGNYIFDWLEAADGAQDYTNGFGMKVNLGPGTGITVFGKPLAVEPNTYVFLRISAFCKDPNVSIAVGALDAVEAADIWGAALNGSIGSNILTDSTRFVENFGYLETLFMPERGAVVPVFQAVNNDENSIRVQFDNLEIYMIRRNQLPVRQKITP